MKIGILTFWESKNNYGQILQLVALQKILINLGHDPFLIKYKRIRPVRNRSFLQKLDPLYVIKVITYRIGTFKNNNNSSTVVNDEKRDFDMFKKRYVVFGDKEYSTFEELKKNPPVADVYMVGSDQVWNNTFAVSAEAFLLGFGDKNIKRISYAASFGQKKISATTQQLFEKYIYNFDSVSVREESGVDICNDLKVDAQWVLDPTMLFTKTDWISLLDLNEVIDKDKSVFIYTLGNSEIVDKDKFIGFFKKLTNYHIIHASANNDTSGNELPTIPEWVNYIKNAEIVITTSFHGMVFCLLNNTNFIVLPNTGHAEGMNERILSLLKLLKLEDHMVEKFSENEVSNIFSKKIDWDYVNKTLDKNRKYSLDFINSKLVK